MSLSILKVPSNGIVDGKVTETFLFAVVDSASQVEGQPISPIDGKLHTDLDKARAAKTAMADVAEGLEYAKARFPEMSPKAQIGKANVIADYIKWIAEGRVVTEVTQPEA